MAFSWDQYQQDPSSSPGIMAPGGAPYEQGGITGQPSVDPSQLQPQPTTPSGWYQDPSQGKVIDPYMNLGPGGQAGIYPWVQGTPPPGYVDPSTQMPSKGGATGGGVTMQQFNQAWLSSPYPGTVDGLKQFMAAHPEYASAGITLGGSKGDKVYGPGGSYWGDAVISAGAGGLGKSGLSGDTGGGGGGTLGSIGAGSFVSPIGQFAPPTAEDALNSPGLQFALSEANRMGQNSAAAHGTLLNGRFQQALGASNVQNALQGYGGVYDRALQTFGTNFGVQTRNQDAPYQKFLSLAQLGQGAAAAS
jgi:hypothetical protein